jgi:hypothetical protein
MSRMLPTLVHVRHLYASCEQSPYVATFHESSTALDKGTALEKKELLTTSPTYRLIDLGSHPVFLPLTTIEAVEKGKHLLATSYVGLLWSYLQHVISKFHTSSRGITHQSLTRQTKATTFEVSAFHITLPDIFQPTVLCFPPKGPAQSQVKQPIIFLLNQEVIKP